MYVRRMYDTGLDIEEEEDRAWLAVENMGAESREENACGARRLFAIGQLYEVRSPEDDTEKLCWAIDGHTSLVAEVATGLAISRGRAAAQVKIAIALYTRLPRVLHVAKTGLLDYRMLSTIVSRTCLIVDDEIMGRVDDRLAECVPKWVRLSDPKLESRINGVIAAQDPDAVRIREEIRAERHIGSSPNGDGTAEVYGTLDAAAVAAMEAVLEAMAGTVCPGDPRTKKQLRADAFMAVFAGQVWSCQCGQSDCPGEPLPPTGTTPRAKLIVHVVADRAGTTAMVPGYGLITASALQALCTQSKVSDVVIPPDCCEGRHDPSSNLAEFVRTRDLTCRWPGCEVSAWNCDIDHTVPYPAGPTHPSKLRC